MKILITYGCTMWMKGQPHATLKGGHFLQEDSPVAFARAINDLLASAPEN
ncbi:hypothetical protein [Marinobacter sp.]